MASQELYPRWDEQAFTLPGTQVFDQVCVVTFATARAATTNKGGSCPCCGQHVQVYRRKVYKLMAKCLIWLVGEYMARGGEWISLKSGPRFRGGDNAKLLYWHLAVRHPEQDDLYKPTQLGVDFVARKVSIPKYAYVYDGRVQGFSPERVCIDECLEGDFVLDDIGIAGEAKYG